MIGILVGWAPRLLGLHAGQVLVAEGRAIRGSCAHERFLCLVFGVALAPQTLAMRARDAVLQALLLVFQRRALGWLQVLGRVPERTNTQEECFDNGGKITARLRWYGRPVSWSMTQ
eukprot:5368154-Pyramimonas_sp.AAC.2